MATPGSAPRLTSLSKPTRATLRSSVIIPTLPSVLSELVQNSLDAGATKIEIWIDPSKAGQSIRIEDDGCGIDADGLSKLGRRGRSSMGGSWQGGGGNGGYGFRGEALSAVAALGLLEIITRARDSTETLTKVIRGSKVLFEGTSSRSLGRVSGTTVIVKDLFHDIPVRQASLSATASSLVSACKKVVETFALVRPEVHWTVWKEAAVGGSAVALERVLNLHRNKSTVDIFRNLFGTAGGEKVQSIRVSSGKKRIDGFISLQGSITQSHQHLYVNGYPLDRYDLHSVISRRFSQSRFSIMVDEGGCDPMPTRDRKSPRRLERYPVYVLNIQIPTTELDAAYTPGKTVMGYQDEESIKKFLLAVVDEFLRRHEYTAPSKSKEVSEAPAGTPTMARTALVSLRPASTPLRTPQTPIVPRSVSALSGYRTSRLGFAQSVQSAPRVGEKRKMGSEMGEYRLDESGRKRYKWIEDILTDVDSGLLPLTPKSATGAAQPFTNTSCTRCSQSPETLNTAHTTAIPMKTSTLTHTSTDITFTADALSRATVLGQIDFKFIATVVPPSTTSPAGSGSTLIMIDQHAADERISVESLLIELCEGFLLDTIPITELQEPLPAVILGRQEAVELSTPGVADIFARWGIELAVPSVGAFEGGDGLGEYVQVPIRAVPTALKVRLGRKEASEMTRLIKLFLPVLADGLGQVQSLIERGQRNTQEDKVDWGEVLRWMPKEMLELANSKACRNAIMFGDRLTVDQCERLVHQLGKMRFPFMCAHGRPSLVPIMKIGKLADIVASSERNTGWKDWAGKVRL